MHQLYGRIMCSMIFHMMHFKCQILDAGKLFPTGGMFYIE